MESSPPSSAFRCPTTRCRGDLLTSVMQRDMDSLRTAIEQVDRGQFEQMVDKLLKAQHIYLLGMRSSSFLTGYLNFYFRLIFKNVTLVQNAVAGETFEQLVQVQPGDVLLAISFPRYSKMTVNAVQYAREKGADVVAITDSTASAIRETPTCGSQNTWLIPASCP